MIDSNLSLGCNFKYHLILIIFREALLLVTEKKIGDKTVFLCDICGLGYSEKNIAQDCEDYCKAHAGSCSVEITKKAVYFPDMPILPEEK